jgi:hypothetical protein
MQRFISIGSKARVGKDSLANLLFSSLNEKGFYTVKRSLATPLKEECDDFLKSQFNISAFTENNEEKELIRPILVSVGSAHRTRSRGQYFTWKLAEWLRKRSPSPQFVITPDLRYAIFSNDELQWFQSQNAYIIDVDRIDENGQLIPPANSHEATNSEIIKKAATEVLVWKTYGNQVTPEMKKIADKITQNILNHFNLSPA